MAKVPELNGLMVAPAGARQGRFEYSQVKSDPTAPNALKNLAEKSSALVGLHMRESKKARDDMLDARATELANRFYTAGTEMTVGKNGALRQTGVTVVQPQDGVPFSAAFSNRLDQERDAVLFDITDPELRKRTEKLIAPMYRSFQAQVISHEGAESKEYMVTQAKVGVSVATEGIRLNGATSEGIAQLHEASLRLASVTGMDTKDPNVRKAVLAETRSAASGAVKEKVYSFLDRNDIPGAEASFVAASAQDALTLEDRYTLQKMIGEAKDVATIANGASRATYDIVAARSPGHVAAQAAFGPSGVPSELAAAVGVEIPEGAADNASLMGSVGASVIERLADEYGSVEAAVTAGVIGKDRMDQAIAEGGASGWTEKLTPTEKSAATRAIKKLETNTGLRMAPTETEIRAALEPWVPPRLMGDAVDAVKARLAEEDLRNQATQYQAATETLSVLEQGGAYPEVPPSVRRNLTPEQQRAARVLASRDPRKPVVGNSAERMRLENNPELLRDMSDADFAIVVRSWTTDEEYAALASRRNALRGMNSIDTDVNRSDIKAAVDAYGRQKFGPDWDENTPEMKYKRARIYDEAYTRAVEAAKQTVGLGGAAKGQTPEVVDAAVRSTFDTRLNVQGGWFTNDSDVAWYDLTLDDFSTEAKGVGRLLATSMFNEREPSDHMVKETIIRWAYDPKGNPPEEAMKQIRREYGDELDAVQAEFKAARGRALDDGALIRAFILKSQDDESWYRLVGREKAPRATPAQFSSDGAVVDPFTYDGFDK